MSAKGMLAAPQTTLKNVSTLDHGSSTTVKEDGNDFCVLLNPAEVVTACPAAHSDNVGAVPTKPMSIEPEVIMYTDCNTLHLEVSQAAVSGDKVSLTKTDAENALKTHNESMKYNACVDDERIQGRETETRATTSTDERAYPVSFPCKECGWEKSLALYAPSHHTLYYKEKIINTAFQITTFNTTMTCRNCEGERVRELQCKGACHLLKTLDEFTKEQRILGTNLCLDCFSSAGCKSTALDFAHLAATAPDNSKAYKNKSDAEKNNIIASLKDTIADNNKTITMLKEAIALDNAGQAHDELTRWLNSVKRPLPKKTLLNVVLDFTLRDLYTIIRHRVIPHNLRYEYAYRTSRHGATQLRAGVDHPRYHLSPETNTLVRTNTSIYSAADSDSTPSKAANDAERKLAHMDRWPMYPAKHALSMDDLKAEVEFHRELLNQYQATHEKLKKAFLLLTLFMLILLLAYFTANLAIVLFWPGEIKRLPIGF